MNTKNIAITTGVIASVIGLGFLSYFLFSKKEIGIAENNEQVDPSLPISQPEKMIEAISADNQEVVISEDRNEEVIQQENEERFDFVEMDNLPDVDSEVVEFFDEADSFENPIEVVETAIDSSTTTTEKQGIIEDESALKSEVLNDDFPLQLGSKGKRIERLQVWLLRNYGYSGKITAVFDKKTLKLVQKHLKTVKVDEQLYNRLEMKKRVYEQSSIS